MSLDSNSKVEAVRLFTMQSVEVYRNARRGIYRARSDKARAPWRYDTERQQLHGVDPIWCYIFTFHDEAAILNLEMLRGMMHLPATNTWDDFVLLELEMPKMHVVHSVNHGSSGNLVMVPYLCPVNLVAAYTITDSICTGDLETEFHKGFFKKVTPIYRNPLYEEYWFEQPVDLAELLISQREETKGRVTLPSIHHLKTWPRVFEEVYCGNKSFELRKDDRGFKLGDILNLQEWDPETEEYSDRYVCKVISYVLQEWPDALMPGYVALSLRDLG